jgi:hypothetical protein
MDLKSSEYKSIEDAYLKLLGNAISVLDEIKVHTLTARKAMDLDPVDANTLANEIVELAILNQRLGDRVSDAGVVARAAENHYKTVREEHKLRLVSEKKMAAGVADSAKMKLSENEFDLYNAATGLYEQLLNMRRSSDKTIDAIRSKLSFEKIDYKNS